MPTIEEVLGSISNEVSLLSADIAAITSATTENPGLVYIAEGENPANNAVATIEFLKAKNLLLLNGQAGNGLPQEQIDKIASLPSEQILSALALLPSDISTLSGNIIAVNSAGDGYEVISMPSAFVADGSITSQKIANKNVTLGKIADGTPGRILKFNDISGVIEEADINLITGGGLNLLDVQTASNSAQVDLTSGINSSYQFYMIVINNLVAGTNDTQLQVRTSSNGGASFDGTAGHYSWGYIGSRAHGASAEDKLVSDNAIKCVPKIGNSSGKSMNAVMKLFSPADSSKETLLGYECFSVDTDGTGHYFINGMGVRMALASVNALRFFMSSGNILSGTFKLYGIA